MPEQESGDGRTPGCFDGIVVAFFLALGHKGIEQGVVGQRVQDGAKALDFGRFVKIFPRKKGEL